MYEWVCISVITHSAPCGVGQDYVWMSSISVLTHSAPCGVGQDYVWMSMHFSSHPLCSMWCWPGLCMNEYAFQFSPTLLHVVLARTMYEWVCIQFSPTLLHVVLARTMYEWVCISVITHSAPCGVGQDYVWMSMYFSSHPLCSMWCRPGLCMNEYVGQDYVWMSMYFSSHPLCSMWCRPGLCMNEYVFQFSPTLLHVV